MPESTRLYLRDTETSYRPAAWFQNTKPNEMLFGIYSLKGSGRSVLRAMWPEIDIDTVEAPIHYKYSDLVDVGLTVDHVTCHADGMFHMKTTNHKDLYVHEMKRVAPLGADTPTFLDISITSDLPEHHASVGDQPKYPNVWVNAVAGNCTKIRAMFSGANYNSEAVMADLLTKLRAPPACLKLESGTIKGLLAPQLLPVSVEASANRPRGTILSFLFPLAGTEHWRVKTFLFE